jgi:hypothetical protein
MHPTKTTILYPKGEKMLKKSLLTIPLLFLISCGGGTVDPPEPTIEEKYRFTISMVDTKAQFDMQKLENKLTQNYFDFDNYGFIASEDKQIFVNGSRGALSDISYSSNGGEVKASFNGSELFSITQKSKEAYQSERFEEYHQNITLSGYRYVMETSYKQNYIIINALASSESYESLEDFVNEYRSQNFIMRNGKGLYFYQSDRLLQRVESKDNDAGTYQIITVDNKEVLLIDAMDKDNYGSNLCYVLDFSRVWESECYLKDSVVKQSYYDKAIYNQVEEYFKSNFVDVNVGL